MQLSKNEYQQFVVDIINKKILTMENQIDKDDVLQPLTGRRIGLDAVDMLALFFLIEERMSKPLLLENIYVFWNIESLATCLMNLDDEKLKDYIGEGEWKNG